MGLCISVIEVARSFGRYLAVLFFLRHFILCQLFDGVLSPFAGGGVVDADYAPATSVMLVGPEQIALDETNQCLYIIESDAHRVRNVELVSHLIRTLAGSSESQQGDRDGNGTEALFRYPKGCWWNKERGYLLVVDSENSKLKKVKLLEPQAFSFIVRKVMPNGDVVTLNVPLRNPCYITQHQDRMLISCLDGLVLVVNCCKQVIPNKNPIQLIGEKVREVDVDYLEVSRPWG